MRHRHDSDNKMTFTFIQIWILELLELLEFRPFYFSDIACTHQINNSICIASVGMLIPSL